jgi:hypothetical protein
MARPEVTDYEQPTSATKNAEGFFGGAVGGGTRLDLILYFCTLSSEAAAARTPRT